MHKLYNFNGVKAQRTNPCTLLYYREFICGIMQKYITAICTATTTPGSEYLRSNKQRKYSL